MNVEEKHINADGFLNVTGSEKSGEAVTAPPVTNAAEKTANQLYKEYQTNEKKKGANAKPFKEWLKEAQQNGTLKNIQEQGLSLIKDLVGLAKGNKDKVGSETDETDVLLAKIDESDLTGNKKDNPSPAFLGVPMPVWYIGIGLVVVVGGYALIKNIGGKDGADAPPNKA